MDRRHLGNYRPGHDVCQVGGRVGFHICEYCKTTEKSRYPITSSGDVTLVFDSGRAWQMPDMILHYVADHNWLPPAELIEDVMKKKMIDGERLQTKGIPTNVGYLSGPFETGRVPKYFVEKLESLMHQAERQGNRIQFRDAIK